MTTEELMKKYSSPNGASSSTPNAPKSFTPDELMQKYSTVPTSNTPVPQTEDQRVLQQLQQRKTQQDSADLQEQSQRQGLGKVFGAIGDFTKGMKNQAAASTGNLATFGGDIFDKLGLIDKSQLPVQLQKGTESNKFITDDSWKGTNNYQRGGAALYGTAEAFAPVPGAGKITAAVKGTELLRGLANSKGVAGFVGRNAPDLVKNLAEGVQGDILLNGEPSLLTTGAITGGNILGGFLKGKVSSQRLLNQAHELFAKGDVEGGNKILSNPDLIPFQQKLGLGTEEGRKANRLKEIAQVDDFLKESTSGAANQSKLINSASEDAKLLAMQFAAPEITKMKGKTDLVGSYNAIGKAKEDLWENIDVVGQFLNKNKILNSNNHSIAKGSDLDVLFKEGVEKTGLDLLQKKSVQAELDKILSAYTDRNKIKRSKVNNLTFKDLNEIRLASNKEGNPYAQDAYDIIADAFRQKMDLDVDKLSQGSEFMNEAGLAKIEALKLFKEMNRQYGDLKDAQKIVNQMSKVSKASNSRFQEMIGGVIATGGTYNPIAYLIGSEATKKVSDALQSITNTQMGLGSKFNPIGVPLASDNLKDFLKVKKQTPAIDKLRKKYGINQ